MNARIEAPSWIPSVGWWAMLAVVIAVGLIGNWVAAAGLLAVLLLQIARPFDFILAFLVVAVGASFVFYAGGRLTYELSLLTGAILLMLVCYVLSNRGRVFTISRTSLTVPMLLYLSLSVANFVRGVLAGYPKNYAGLELIAVLGLGSSMLVANAFERQRDLRIAVLGLLAVGYVNAAGSFSAFGHMHTAGVYDAAVPGIVGLLLINLSLRSKTKAMTLGWIMISLPLFLHQFLTYGRGLWLGCLAGLVVSVLVFAGVGRGSAARWRQVGLVVGMLSALGVLGAVGIAVMSGETDVLLHAGSRFGSITETSTKTGSNIFRLVEYSLALKHIAESPWIGHGIGYTFLGMSAVGFLRFNQWYVHQDFLFVWLKQGIVGLALFVWLIAGAITLGVREARRREDPWESTWFAATAAATVHLTVFALSNFPFGQVNPIFTLALLWGGAMGMTRNGFVRFQWSTPEATAAAG